MPKLKASKFFQNGTIEGAFLATACDASLTLLWISGVSVIDIEQSFIFCIWNFSAFLLTLSKLYLRDYITV